MIQSICIKTGASVRVACAVLGWPRSSFYYAAAPSPSRRGDQQMGALIEAVFYSHHRRYGSRRIQRELGDHAVVCGGARVRRLMKERGLVALQPRRYTPRTSDGNASRPSPNLVAQEGQPKLPDQIWAGDITYIPYSRGWLYLAVVIDLCSRKIVGWSLGEDMRAQLVAQAMEEAVATRRPKADLIFHSDRGSQYSSGLFRAILERTEMRQSMSARANPYDNAWTESFIGTLKLEIQIRTYGTIQEARLELFEYIEGYYNTRRKHSSIGYDSPNQFERKSTSTK